MNKSKFFLFVLVASIMAVSFYFVREPKLLTMLGCFILLLAISMVYRRRVTEELVIALLFALFINSYNPHVYTTFDFRLDRISLFSFLAWTTGLVMLRELHELYRWHFRLSVMSALYIVSLLILEYVGYYILGIKLIGNEPSFLSLGVLHGSTSLHVIYTLAGPAYLLVTDYLRTK